MFCFKDKEEFVECIRDLLDAPSVQYMEGMTQHVDVNCLQHCIFVSYVSFRICKFFHWEFVDAARGGLLHDLFLYNWKTEKHEGLHGFTHPKTALRNASRLFRLNDREKDIIVKHMWPLTLKLPRYKEFFVVCGVDKICALAEMLHIYHMMHVEKKLNFSPA